MLHLSEWRNTNLLALKEGNVCGTITDEAEYIATSLGSCQVVLLINQIQELTMKGLTI